MKRKVFTIKSTDGHSSERYSFNAARAEIRDMAREIATLEDQVYYRMHVTSECDAAGKVLGTNGGEVWKGRTTGKCVTFTIKLEA
jgi:uncharacterized protein YecE (DUF72 family)